MHPKFLSILIAFLLFSNATAEDCHLTGVWQGALKLSGQELRIVFKISQNHPVDFSATMDSPDQGATGIPVSEVAVKGAEILLKINSIGGVYQGIVQNDKQHILGTWKQNRFEFSLNLTRSAVEPAKILPAGPKQTDENESELILKTATGELFGTLTIPNLAAPYPVGFIIAGSGPTDRDGNNPMMKNNSLKMLAAALAENGIASLRFDKRGVGKSQAAGLKEIDLRFENYVEDAFGWIELLKTDGRFDDIVVIGHSEGALIGMIASQQKNVDKFISIAAAGQAADKIIHEQLQAQPPIVLEQAIPILEKLVRGETVADVPPMLNSLFRPVVQPYLMSWFKYNPEKEIAKLDKPVLILQGTTDIQIRVSDAEMLAKANPKAKKVIIDGMNHVLKAADADRQKNIQTYSQPELPLKPELIQAIVDFIKEL